MSTKLLNEMTHLYALSKLVEFSGEPGDIKVIGLSASIDTLKQLVRTPTTAKWTHSPSGDHFISWEDQFHSDEYTYYEIKAIKIY